MHRNPGTPVPTVKSVKAFALMPCVFDVSETPRFLCKDLRGRLTTLVGPYWLLKRDEAKKIPGLLAGEKARALCFWHGTGSASGFGWNGTRNSHRCRALRSTQGWVAREPGPHHQPQRASPPLQISCRRRRIATWKVFGRSLTGMAVSGSGSLLCLQRLLDHREPSISSKKWKFFQ